ncbi:carbon-nitrogen hydrolase family protein [Azospirillum sp. RWY-5-1]|uniref:Carbon-nitrogen hydrolase family protein n=1 Tax=Azospirillum oleiclasticum TaxID=2735135 RepID=A0ABX2T4N1_9PROT|nr:carbon-nitrogen hydrolase family protein [Azospirillum oleiclasticum]NYZ12096.1 carbon-nitrogen hydrolase family protein [Azospirillum oleiclasticum]NYZ19256.1 carbon-nitrogen hydrolase family protein [Azospirillum oleiclasticum]
MRIAVAQTRGESGRIDANLALLEDRAHAARDAEAGLLVLPELFLTGYNTGPTTAALAEPVDGPSLARAADIARATGTALLFGFAERAGNAVYNAAILIDAAGTVLGCYRKAHLYGDEKQRFSPGAGMPLTAHIGGLRCGVLICYDVEFPEAVRDLALRGCQAVLVPTALPAGMPEIPGLLVRARAYENQIFVAYADRCGEEDGLAYEGRSCIVGPDGVVLAAAGAEEALLVADLDPAAVRTARLRFDYLADRRPNLYARLIV